MITCDHVPPNPYSILVRPARWGTGPRIRQWASQDVVTPQTYNDTESFGKSMFWPESARGGGVGTVPGLLGPSYWEVGDPTCFAAAMRFASSKNSTLALKQRHARKQRNTLAVTDPRSFGSSFWTPASLVVPKFCMRGDSCRKHEKEMWSSPLWKLFAG